jgi:hypothetical protein
VVAPVAAAAGKKIAGKVGKAAARGAANKSRKSKIMTGLAIGLVLSPFAAIAGMIAIICLVVGGLAGNGQAATCEDSCTVSASEQANAQILMDAYSKGTFFEVENQNTILWEIKPVAEGTPRPGCAVDPRIFQILVLTLNRYHRVGISDLARPCIGLDLNCGFSAHCKNPATAVDFTNLGGTVLTGGDPESIDLVTYLDTIMPTGSRAGQIQCRPAIPLVHLTPFFDTAGCNHQHIDLIGTDAPLNVTTQ